jgi:hypothetical protein
MMLLLAFLFVVAVAIGTHFALAVAGTILGTERKPAADHVR